MFSYISLLCYFLFNVILSWASNSVYNRALTALDGIVDSFAIVHVFDFLDGSRASVR